MRSLSQNPSRARIPLLLAGGLSVLYCLAVLFTVATTEDIRVRWLLIGDRGVEALKLKHAPDGVTIQQTPGMLVEGPVPRPGDVLVRVGNRRIRTSLDVPAALFELSRSKSQGQLTTIVDGHRWLPIEFRRDDASEPVRTLVALQSAPLNELGLTVVWFLLEMVIFIVGTAAVWRRPYDRPARYFYGMCVLALAAFVGGFHWWLLAGSAWLGPPFVLSAALLPVVTLHFFLIYPRPKPFLDRAPVAINVALYSVPGIAAAYFLAIQTWVLATLFSQSGGDYGLWMMQRLEWLRLGIYAYLGIAGLYFAATLAAIVHSVITSRSPLERKQVVWILWAALIATVLIGYTLMLAYWNRAAFALGGARVPMFLASLVFMLAYAVGIVKYKLMLAEEWVGRSVWYHAVRGSVALLLTGLTVGFAVVAGRSTAHLSAVQTVVMSVTLVVAAASLLWGRDLWQRWVERRWFREKYRLDKALQRINRAVGQFSDPQFLSERTLLSCRDGVQAEWAALYLQDRTTSVFRLAAVEGRVTTLPLEWTAPADWLSGAGQEGLMLRPIATGQSLGDAAEWWQRLGAELLQPVEIDGEIAGLLAVGPKPAGTGYTAEDAAFLAALTQITGVALHCVRVHQDLTQLNEQLRLKVERIAQQKQQIVLLQAELAATRQTTPLTETDDSFRRDNIKGGSPALLRVIDTARKVAVSGATVLLRGESGTGKELFARSIHENSPRRNGPLVSVHCAALAPGVLESELFGHVRGAFTGATADKRGRFELADGGTLFLDEIGDISLETQVKLLRALQEREIEPVGGSGPISVNVRVIAATHRPLEELIAAGKFREDLYYRLNVVTLWLPPLRERKEDLHELAASFLKQASTQLGKDVHDFDEAALDALLRYEWPGNIRELENVIERAVVLAERDVIRLEDLPTDIQQRLSGSVAVTRQPPITAPRLASAAPRPWREVEAQDERRRLITALQQSGGNKARAAKLLGLPRSTFFSKLKKHALAD